MLFEETWRWFGPNDSITLKEIKQTGASGIVTALHQIPVGEIWSIDNIMSRNDLIKSEGLTWSVVESVPVHENLKKRKGNFSQLIENYKTTIKNLGQCGIRTVCYNFMPVLDWSRTNLNVEYSDGSITTKFEKKAFAAFDLFILKRVGAENDYDSELIKKAEQYYGLLKEDQKITLAKTILFGLPGSWESYSIDEFNKVLYEYSDIDDSALRYNLQNFLLEIIPVAEEAGVCMAIHPDDPPFPLLGLSRIVSTKNDLQQIITAVDSLSNGLTLCTGSLGASINNDLVDIANSFKHRVNFIHLRNISRNGKGDFMEENHLEGDIDLYSVMKILLLEQRRRNDENGKEIKIPIRSDHGHLMLPDQNRQGIYPGYSLFGRMRGLAELRGLEMGIIRSLNL